MIEFAAGLLSLERHDKAH